MKFDVSISVTEKGRRRPEYTIDSDINGEVTLKDLLEYTKGSLIVIADEVLKEEQDKGFDKNPVFVVDGRRNKPVSAVSPLGSIEIVARMDMGDIVLETYNALLYRSKVLTGRYKSSHFVFHNGKQVATDLQSLAAWLNTNPQFKQKDAIRIVNIQPYARRLERLGVTAQRQQNRRAKSRRGHSSGATYVAPNGTYFLTARAIKAKYKQNTFIKFTFLPGSSLGLSGSFKGGRAGRNSAGRPYLYPTIVFSVQERGIV